MRMGRASFQRAHTCLSRHTPCTGHASRRRGRQRQECQNSCRIARGRLRRHDATQINFAQPVEFLLSLLSRPPPDGFHDIVQARFSRHAGMR